LATSWPPHKEHVLAEHQMCSLSGQTQKARLDRGTRQIVRQTDLEVAPEVAEQHRVALRRKSQHSRQCNHASMINLQARARRRTTKAAWLVCPTAPPERTPVDLQSICLKWSGSTDESSPQSKSQNCLNLSVCLPLHPHHGGQRVDALDERVFLDAPL
jgi:hypothetical protein